MSLRVGDGWHAAQVKLASHRTLAFNGFALQCALLIFSCRIRGILRLGIKYEMPVALRVDVRGVARGI
jgi:hypothetical protein